ncbi:ICMT-domain-containing protein [Heliocybe sulcata]|uniref:Protein-S-isoprenylcysteine O-methyltransferase n=1 Tax=Heliocybe sulcata TaxID=5364 RepID=A0A5C3N9M3_9AGAM|nr:ICMT-domain-containing protein [Heliocybe sulcata]
MHSPSLRIALLLACAASSHLCFRAPNPPPPQEEQLKKTSTFERRVRWVTFSCQVRVPLFHIYVPFSFAYPHEQAGAALGVLCDAAATYALPLGLLEIEPTFLLGVSMMVFGCFIRQWCFQTLGRLFTFEVSISPEHRLVTGGPYAYVRHPSYTGIFLVLAGATTVMCSRNSWFRQCGILERGGAPLLVAWMALCIWSANCLRQRLRVEDEELKIRFGKIWEDYAARVPYTLIPGLV